MRRGAGRVALARVARARALRLRPLRGSAAARRHAEPRRLPRVDIVDSSGILDARNVPGGQTLVIRARREANVPGGQRAELRSPDGWGRRDAVPEPCQQSAWGIGWTYRRR